MKRIFQISFVVFFLTQYSFAHAYVGPGAGLSALGTIVAFIGACLLIIIGFVWYPIKRLLKWLKKTGKKENNGPENSIKGNSGISSISEKSE
jgi:predicted PurR-regulated permease PerM